MIVKLKPLLISFLFTTLITFSHHAFAYDNSENCNQNLQQCITDLKLQIDQTPKATHLWFNQKLNLLDMLFIVQRYHEIIAEVNELLALPNKPLRVELNSYMYKVKLHQIDGDINVDDYTLRVDNAFKELAKSGNPQAIIDYATFQLYTGDFDKGLKLLLALEAKFVDHQNSFIKKKIYTILGYLSHRLENHEATLKYMELALSNANNDNGRYYQLLALYNVARAQHFLGNDEQAIPQLNAVIAAAQQLQEVSFESLAYLRLAEIYTDSNNLNSAKSALDNVQTQHLLKENINLYHKLQCKLSAAQSC
ncbi:hypothetical protein [Colwellia sp. MEBiC06753]